MRNEELFASGFASGGEEQRQRALVTFNSWRLGPMLPSEMTAAREAQERQLEGVELAFVESERARVQARAAEAPRDADAFLAWYEALERTGPGQHDPLFEWLEQSASLAQMRWFMGQEVAGEAGFDDLVALTQVKMAPRAKLELARNYWDEMGQGHATGMHGPMLSALADELEIAHGEGGPWCGSRSRSGTCWSRWRSTVGTRSTPSARSEPSSSRHRGARCA